MTDTHIKNAVREKYGLAALRAGEGCCGASACNNPITSNLYSDHETGALPDAAEKNVPKFVLINTLGKNPDHGTLLHEMVHASFPGESPVHDPDARSIYSVATARDRLNNADAKRLSGAFFARE